MMIFIMKSFMIDKIAEYRLKSKFNILEIFITMMKQLNITVTWITIWHFKYEFPKQCKICLYYEKVHIRIHYDY